MKSLALRCHFFFALWRFFVLSMIVGGLLFPVHAAEQVENFYTVELPLASKSTSARNKATIEALKVLFVRISGQYSVLDNPAIKASYRRAERYLKQFSYIESDDTLDGQPSLSISMQFESSLIEELLRDNGLPIWSRNRPTVLTWLVVDDLQGRHFVGDGDVEIVKQLQSEATRRGLVLKFPVLDLDDTIALSVAELWSLNRWTVQRAAARYATDALLIGRMTQLSNGHWLGSWVFEHAGELSSYDGQANLLQDYIANGLDVVSAQLAAKYAIVPVEMSNSRVVMRLTGVKDFTDYARALNYLNELAAVRYANPIRIKNDELLIHLIADGQLQQLQQALALDKRLLPEQPLDTLSANDYPLIQLNYHWPETQH